MTELSTVTRADGVVLPPPEVAARYRAEGWWDDTLLPDLVLRAAAGHPDAVALVDAASRLTYAELAAAVDGLTARLATAGLARGDRVLVRLPNSVEFVITMLALMRLEARPILAAPALRDREIGHVLRLARPTAMVVNAPLGARQSVELAERMRAEHPALTRILVLGDAPTPAPDIDLTALIRAARTDPPTPGDHRPAPLDRPDDVAFYLLSSGTTGLPKPIPRTHQDYGCALRANNEVCAVTPQTVFLAALTAAHTFTLGCPGVLGVLAGGGTVVLTNPEPENVAELLARHRVTMTASVPALAVQIAEAVRAGGHDTSALRVVQVGGARLAPRQGYEVVDTLGCRLQQAYGMSEGMQNYTRLDDPLDIVASTQGRPVAAADEWRVVDDDGADVPPGASGELLTRGPHVIGGYLAGDAVNERAFTADGFFRTGDVVHLDPSGNFVVEGRRQDFVNVAGEKVSAQELEELLLEHPKVARCAVVPAPHPNVGEAPCAFVVPAGADAPTLRELRVHLDRAGIARYKLPTRLELLEELPMTTLGKLDRGTLRTRVAEA
ncbi:(2,3-dihydroxybenzoyl)adenylate synthase [Dactylosporangium sp. NPDC051541]|uniref:(2,3-dihydroxybenzoyl)adenylate synthase n=1 Tax=Dactylosporangium sp. NPDC051541 TaxID=3363977 RepID=UPI0037BA1804